MNIKDKIKDKDRVKIEVRKCEENVERMQKECREEDIENVSV